MDKNQLKFTSIVSQTREIPVGCTVKGKNGWLSWGTDNNYPNYLWDLFIHSSQFNSIVSTMINYILGDEVVNNTRFDTINRKGDTFNDLIVKLATDYIIFGGYAFQIIRNRLGDVVELNYTDFRNIRTNENEDTIYVSKNWNKKSQPVVYERFVRGAKQPNSIYYFKGNLTREQYPVPSYIAAITSIEISTQIANYHLHNITNNFSPSVVINFNNGTPTEDEQAQVEELIYDKFSGTSNAGSVLLSFNDNKEHSTTIERLSDDGLDNKYQTLSESVREDIYSAFRINPILVGKNGQTGFTQQEFVQSFALYQKTVIYPIQKDLIDSLEKVFGNGCIEIKPFTVDFENEINNNTVE